MSYKVKHIGEGKFEATLDTGEIKEVGPNIIGMIRYTYFEDFTLPPVGWDKQTCQVKEKFGGLRFYINSGSNEIHDRIAKAENDSYNICEKCGEEGKLRNDIGWYLTLCENHYNEKKESYEKRNTKV